MPCGANSKANFPSYLTTILSLSLESTPYSSANSEHIANACVKLLTHILHYYKNSLLPEKITSQ